jgi:hypothetical protein
MYTPLDPDWIFIPPRSREGANWKIGMLGYRMAKKERLLDLHIIATKPSHPGNYSDAHVTFVESDQKKQHLYYQVNGGRLVADYVLAPHGWRASYWTHYPMLRDSTEAEVLHFVEYWREEGKLENPPRAV